MIIIRVYFVTNSMLCMHIYCRGCQLFDWCWFVSYAYPDVWHGAALPNNISLRRCRCELWCPYSGWVAFLRNPMNSFFSNTTTPASCTRIVVFHSPFHKPLVQVSSPKTKIEVNLGLQSNKITCISNIQLTSQKQVVLNAVSSSYANLISNNISNQNNNLNNNNGLCRPLK